MLLMGVGGAKIKSVQVGTTTLSSGKLSATAVINPVDQAKAFVIADYRGGENNISSLMATATITDPTTLTFQRESALGTCTIYWQVVELDGNATVQSFLTSFTGSSTSVAISKVDPEKAIVVTTCRTTSRNNGFDSEAAIRVRGVIEPDGLTVTLSHPSTSATTTVSGFVVEVK